MCSQPRPPPARGGGRGTPRRAALSVAVVTNFPASFCPWRHWLGECRSVEHEMTPDAARLLIADGPLAKQLFADHYDALVGNVAAVRLVKLRS